MSVFGGLDSYIAESRSRFESWLGRLVEVPTVSMDPDRKDDIRAGASVAVEYLTAVGADASIVETGGHPLVVGRWSSNPQWPTVTIYNHLDVQPALEPEWIRAPFQFVVDGDMYYGRGTTDDKGPALTALLSARYAVEHKVPINIQFCWELEEEIGSPHFGNGLDRASALVPPDSVVVSDTVWLAGGRPAIPYGLRGLLAVRLSLTTAEREAHSGLTGGAARNPLTELCAAIAECVDAKTGRVKIPGFYDDARQLANQELVQFRKSGFDVKSFAAEHRLTKLRTNNRDIMMRRIWAEPTFEVHGLVGGYTGPGVKTSIAPRAEAKVSMRLVPNQEPDRVLRVLTRYLRRLNPDICVEADGMLRPYAGNIGGPFAEAARKALTFGFGKEPAFIREGGSIGAVVTMVERWDAPVMFLGLSLPDHGYHAPNERFDWGQAAGGIKTFVKYFDEISRFPRATSSPTRLRPRRTLRP
jgi:acetylornithine deacetylase/succinyl-diaminopimelate desuccinylase-like protein